MKEFKKLDFPRLREYYTKYPQGYTIYESLLDIIEHINEMTGVVNLTLKQWEEIETWVLNELKNYSIDQLQEWLNDGTLEDVINDALFNSKADKTEIIKLQNLLEQNKFLQKGKKDKRPLVVFTSDDATINDKLLLMPIMKEKNIPIGFGVITSSIGKEGYLNFEGLRELEQAGGEILSHSHTHPNFVLITDEERISDIETSLSILNDNGFYPQGFIYPFNDNNLDSEMIVSRYFNYAYTRSYLTMSGRNFPILNNQAIDRVALDPDTTVDPNHPSLVTNTLGYYQAKVDEAVANNSIVAFMMHANTMDATQRGHLRNLIDYIRSIGVDIVSPKEAFNIAGNIAQIKTENHDFRISADGQYVGENLSIVVKQDNLYTANDNLSVFRTNTVTHSYITTSQATGLPNNSAGILTTYRVGNQFAYVKQEYRPYNSRGLWQRTALVDGNWSEWKEFGKEETNYVDPLVNKYTAQTPITTYPSNRITTSFVTGSQTTGMPNNKAGVLITYRVGNQEGFWRQEFKPYMETGTWERMVLVGGAWGNWVKISA